MSSQSEEPDSRGASFFDKIALFSAVVSLLCVLGAHLIDRMSRDGTLAALAGSRSAPAIDYSATATIGKPGTVPLNPCGNR
ncbi:hypothetical protein CCR94_05385 [Rhodoblastus sphagnicola]|uniref:Uncharacterized protein n=1 Tax=Rhodoblastus sphagnicola TaxID=333368 RepID=A0A2S6NDC3_9HYPH|nr:hypothetical protein [Rhodoblastus sphagnicola]MBB4197947.1 putative transporter YbjL [Rhodoblastus sphagnicola]PPQ32607.1 hypothetical protein CCR94_05385 [Rhodoblastus sphagnicola]